MIKIDSQSIIDEFEPKRASAFKKYVILLIIGVLLIGGGVGFLWLFNDWSIALAAILFIAGIILIVIAISIENSFRKNFLNRLSSQVLGQVFPGYKSFPKAGMALNEILYPGFFIHPDKWNTSNLLEAEYNGIPFRVSDYTLMKRERRTDAKGNAYYVDVTYAQGKMFRFQFTKNFKAVVKVLEKAGGISFGEKGLQKCETEFIAFNNKFVVYASDQLTVFYILTPQIQEKVLELENSLQGQFYMAFINNELYIAANNVGGDFYKFKFSKPITLESIRTIIAAIIVPATFIDMLKIDDRKFSSDSKSL